uniref:Uncharacterized protein n=1 Tax=Rhizophora mucronata TaxID=61149 RepID=A0A2P2PEQ3_RHIMU
MQREIPVHEHPYTVRSEKVLNLCNHIVFFHKKAISTTRIGHDGVTLTIAYRLTFHLLMQKYEKNKLST